MVWLNWSQIPVDGQHASPGKHRQLWFCAAVVKVKVIELRAKDDPDQACPRHALLSGSWQGAVVLEEWNRKKKKKNTKYKSCAEQ